MLSIIDIKQFLYIENTVIELSDGLNVFTGETGVGKSLILNAINFVLGKKGNYENNDFVELVFESVNTPFSDSDGTLIVSRQIKNNKSYYFLNGKRATLSTIKEATKDIIEIHSQHSYHSLFSSEFPRITLDNYSNLSNLLDKYKVLYLKFKKLEEMEKNLKIQQSESLKEIDIVEYQLQELEALDATLDKKEIEERFNYLKSISDIKLAVEEAKYIISDKENSIEEDISYVSKILSPFYEMDTNIKNAHSLLESAKELIKEAYYALSDLDFDFSEEEINELESKLNFINRLEAKYNTDYKGLFKIKKQLKNRLEELKDLEFKIPEIEKEKDEVYKELIKLSEEISQIRKEKAKELEKLIVNNLEDLALKGCQFVVNVEDCDINIYGKNKVEFLFSANKGIKPQPLNKVASGGELSRISLVLKLISKKSKDTIVFDEIDTGIGGKTAIYMAEKLYSLSKNFQVILVTHLPQIASIADTHYLIEKKFDGEKTFLMVNKLSGECREREIARMLSGIINDKSLKHARELLNQR